LTNVTQDERGGANERTDPLPPAPTFLIIGAQKSATRWLRLNLGFHPDIFTADGEPNFFNSAHFQEGLEWYRAQFAGWSGEPIVGEATPGYMFWRHGPARFTERIDETLPGVKLLAILRNPVDRALSALIHHIEGGGLPADTELIEYARTIPPQQDRFGIVVGGWYAASLQPWFSRFGERLAVLLHNDLEDDPRGLYDAAVRHVGAEPNFVPRQLDRVRFSYQQRPDNRHAERTLSLEQRRRMYEYFADDIRRLERMLDRDLSLWDPEQPAS
jgi:Sulfotransferase domain